MYKNFPSVTIEPFVILHQKLYFYRLALRSEKNMINLLCSVLLICITQQAICSHLSKHPVLLTVSFDGFRYDYMSKADMPTLRVIQEEGVSVPYMKAQFPTKTFPNHQSIATGVYPDIHGITDNTVYDPMYGKKLSGFSDDPAFWNYSPDVIPFWVHT